MSDSLQPYGLSSMSMGFSSQEYWSGLPFSFSRGSSQPRDQTSISCFGRYPLYHWVNWEANLFISVVHGFWSLTCIWMCRLATGVYSLSYWWMPRLSGFWTLWKRTDANMCVFSEYVYLKWWRILWWGLLGGRSTHQPFVTSPMAHKEIIWFSTYEARTFIPCLVLPASCPKIRNQFLPPSLSVPHLQYNPHLI